MTLPSNLRKGRARLVSTLGSGGFCPCLTAIFLEYGVPDATLLMPLTFFLEPSIFVAHFSLSGLVSGILPRISSPALRFV